MKKLVLFGFALILSIAFGSNISAQKVSNTEVAASYENVDELLENAESVSGKVVSVKGICTHVCKHSGAKIYLEGSDDQITIRCNATKKSGLFKPECKNHMVTVEGVLVAERIDEAYVQKLEKQLNAQSASKKHGNEAAGCENDMKARHEKPANSVDERITNLRAQIAEYEKETGKNYYFQYFIRALNYKVEAR